MEDPATCWCSLNPQPLSHQARTQKEAGDLFLGTGFPNKRCLISDLHHFQGDVPPYLLRGTFMARDRLQLHGISVQVDLETLSLFQNC